MSIKATQPEDSAVKKMTPGDDLHLTLLGVPMGWNFLIGQDRAEMLAYGRAVWNAALATPSPQPAEAKTAAVDGDAKDALVAALRAVHMDAVHFAGNEFAISRATLDKVTAAIATQEGGHD